MIKLLLNPVSSILKGLILSWIIMVIIHPTVFCQDITTIKSATPVRITGNFNGAFTYNFNNSSNIPPTGYNTGLNINFNLFNTINIPFNIAYSNYGSSFNTISINRFGISPSYKSVKIHAGHRSYVLSPYLMTGLTVLGGGIELTPKNFNLLAFYGKISDPYTISNEFLAFKDQRLDLYKRNVYGIRFGIGKSSNSVSISAFHAKDNLRSGSVDSLARFNVRGKENFGVATDLTQSFFNVLTISGSGALSILTNDIEGKPIEDSNAVVLIEKASFLTNVNVTTRYSFAYDAKISLRIKTINLGFRYQHIDPFYNSMGVSYLQNNFDNYLIDMNGSLLKGKFNLFSSVGVQYVNASGYTGLPQKRIVGIVNANINFSQSLSLMGNYSNMVQNSTPIVEEVIDSLQIAINNRGWSGSINFKPGKGKQRPHLLSINSSSNTFDVVSNDTISMSNTNNNFSLNYKYTLKSKWSIGGGVLYNTSQGSLMPGVNRYGFSFSAGKTLTEGLNVKANGAYRFNKTESVKDGHVINGSIGVNYQYRKSHRISVDATQLIRKTTILSAKSETRFRFNYYYNF